MRQKCELLQLPRVEQRLRKVLSLFELIELAQELGGRTPRHGGPEEALGRSAKERACNDSIGHDPKPSVDEG
jgi:hypothetical protein